MKLYTTYFAKLKKLPDNIVPVAICGKTIDSWTGFKYTALAPKKWWWIKWKNEENEDLEYYKKMYKETVLDTLNPDIVVSDLSYISEGKDVALVCYERPENFCHRHLVADWLRSNGFDIEEYE